MANHKSAAKKARRDAEGQGQDADGVLDHQVGQGEGAVRGGGRRAFVFVGEQAIFPEGAALRCRKLAEAGRRLRPHEVRSRL